MSTSLLDILRQVRDGELDIVDAEGRIKHLYDTALSVDDNGDVTPTCPIHDEEKEFDTLKKEYFCHTCEWGDG